MDASHDQSDHGPTLLRLFTGYIASALTAALALIAVRELEATIFPTHLPRGLPLSVYPFAFISVSIFLTAWPFVAIVCIVGETRRLRHWVFYTACGALTGVALLFFQEWQTPLSSSQTVRPLLPRLPFILPLFAAAGSVGGLAYWFVSGRWAGTRSRPSRAKRFAFIGSVFLLLSVLVAMCTFKDAFEGTVEDRIFRDLRASSEGKPSLDYIGTFDLICFAEHGNLVQQEFLRENERLGTNFSLSLKLCGSEKSCCNLSSDTEIAALIKNHSIRCVGVNKFGYWLENNSARCMRPNWLRVRKLTPESESEVSAHRKLTPGRPAYLITEVGDLPSPPTSWAFPPTDEELRQMYSRPDFAQIETLAREGDVRAEAWMGLIMQQADRRPESKEWWGRAAEKGNKWAIGSLASMHLMDKEDDKAAYWYRRGAELGYPESQASLASLLLRGRGVPRNEEEAVRLYKAAASQAYKYAYFPLAQLYAAGRGTARDPIEAYALLEIAEATIDSSQIKEPKALRSQLAAELSAEQISQAGKRAREMRPDAFARR
jgi:TPR repeat protein